MSVRRAASQLLASRSVHLKIVPRPANLSESREIYRVLQRFGEISTYKSLRYEYHNPADNVALAIYRDAESAQQALDASPIRFALETFVPTNAETTQWSEEESDEAQIAQETPIANGAEELLRPSQFLNRTLPQSSVQPHKPSAPNRPSPQPMPFEPAPNTQPKQTTSKWFQVTVDRSRVVHQDFVERQPHWKQFNPMKSMAQEDLAKTVPHYGLSDVSKRPPNAHRTPNKVLEKMHHYVDNHMPNLTEMYEEGERELKDRRRP